MEIKRIKDLREDHDLKQKDIAQLLKITQQQYSLYEKGIRTIPIEFLIILANYYNVSLDYITGLTDNPKPNWTIKNNISINGNNNNFGDINMS